MPGHTTKIDRTFDGYSSVRSEQVRIDGALVSDASQGWDVAGRRSSLSLQSSSPSSSIAYTYGYRGDGRLTEVVANNAYRFNYDYGTDGRLRQRRTPWESPVRDQSADAGE